MMITVKEKWPEIIEHLRVEHELSNVSFNTWIQPLKVYDVVDNTVFILVNMNASVEYIEKKYQCTIPDMFAISEEYFRDRESEACLDMAKLDGYIISTGGGVIKRKENRDVLKQAGTVFYIDRPVDNIVTDVEKAHRPLLKDGPEKLYQ